MTKVPKQNICLGSDKICTKSSQYDHNCWDSQANILKVVCGQPDVSMPFLEPHTKRCLLCSCSMRSRQQGTFPMQLMLFPALPIKKEDMNGL